jgi:ankyrin repeat protein
MSNVGRRHSDYEGYTALHWAAELGQANTVSWLLRQPDIDVDIETYDKAHTPLHMAASHGHMLIVQMLYGKTDKTKTVATDDADQVLSPAFLALMNEHFDVAMWLVQAEEKRLGATDPQAVRQFKESLVHLAAMLDNVEVLRVLFEGPIGANADARDSEGNTPLHLAYQVGNAEGIAYLRNGAGCDPLAVNHEGLTPAQMECGEEGSESDGEREDESEENEGQREQEGGDESDGEDNVSQEARNEEDKEEVVGECYFESLPQEIILRVRLARACDLLRFIPTPCSVHQ